MVGVDPDCVKLARKFLIDELLTNPRREVQVERDLASLSEAIQTAIEDWFSDQFHETDRLL
mgnify:CR=1 FL=1